MIFIKLLFGKMVEIPPKTLCYFGYKDYSAYLWGAETKVSLRVHINGVANTENQIMDPFSL